MKIAFFDTHAYDRESLEAANVQRQHQLNFFEPRLTLETAPLANGYDAVCSFVNDQVDEAVLSILSAAGTRLAALRRL